MTGENASDEFRFAALCQELGVPSERLAEAKDALRQNTEEAAARGVFGCAELRRRRRGVLGAPTRSSSSKAFLHDEAVLRNDEMRRVDALPVGASRAP